MNPGQVGYHQLHVAREFNDRAAKGAGVSVTDRCIIDIMYLGRLQDAFGKEEMTPEESRLLWADIHAHVSMAAVSGTLMQEV